jgi:hypothetical protein
MTRAHRSNARRNAAHVASGGRWSTVAGGGQKAYVSTSGPPAADRVVVVQSGSPSRNVKGRGSLLLSGALARATPGCCRSAGVAAASGPPVLAALWQRRATRRRRGVRAVNVRLRLRRGGHTVASGSILQPFYVRSSPPPRQAFVVLVSLVSSSCS